MPCSKLEYVFTFASTIGKEYLIFSWSHADVAKLVDALDLGSSAARHGGSSPSIRTEPSYAYHVIRGFFLFITKRQYFGN